VFDVRKDDPKFFTDPKAISINAHYLRTMPVEEILPYVQAELEAAGIWDPEFAGEKRAWFAATVDLIRSRYHTTKDFATLGRAYFAENFPMDAKACEKHILKHEGLAHWLPLLAQRLAALDEFTPEPLEQAIRDLAMELDVKTGLLTNGVRVVVTGQAAGPGLFEILTAVGKERTVLRLQEAPRLFARSGKEA
jgi:glutamyl-tRNA synthetase